MAKAREPRPVVGHGSARLYRDRLAEIIPARSAPETHPPCTCTTCQCQAAVVRAGPPVIAELKRRWHAGEITAADIELELTRPGRWKGTPGLLVLADQADQSLPDKDRELAELVGESDEVWPWPSR